MGSKCSTLRRGNLKENEYYKPDHKRDEVSTTVESGEKSPFLQSRPSLQEEGGATESTKKEETVKRQEEHPASAKLACHEKSSALPNEYTVVEVNTTSPCLSETHDPAPAVTEEEEADWVDNNRAKLIQSVTLVMAIADEMVQRKIIHNETYANIKAAGTSQEQMRELYRTLTSRKAKSAFYRILQDIQPDIFETEDVIKEVIQKHKAHLREKFKYEFEGTDKDHKDAKSLDKIYTELHIIQGEIESVNNEHEIWEIEEKARSQTAEGTKINCNDIFKSTPEDSVSSGQDRSEVRAIRTVMTKGIAGIGKTVSVKKFILDWADGRANQDLDFIFVLPFRELNLVMDDQLSLEKLVRVFHPELQKIAVARIFASHKVLFIFDGLDESQLQLDFRRTKMLTDATKESTVDTLVTNLIREHLLPRALIWITSRPGAVHRIPRKYVHQWTEVRGFNDTQKIQYFRKRVEDEAVAERIISNITMSRSLYIMCHIPIFCWIAAKVLAHLLLKVDKSHDENIKIPTTLTEMYTHFLCIQMEIATDKYDSQNEPDADEIFKSNEEFILKLGRMAFEHLKEGKIIFTGNDLKNYGIDIHKAGVYCGLCTEIFKEESVFNKRKLYCFVHLTVQEYFAALFVYHSFATKKIDSLSLKDFLLIGSEEELKLLLETDPVDLPLDELMEISIANSTLRKTGELDMFLRFLIGMSLRSTQELLQGLIQQTEEHSAVVEEIKTSLTEMDLASCSPERCLNLVHCLIELKDSSLHDTVQQYLKPNHHPETQLSPVQCSALADSILMSNTPLDEFDLKKYRPSTKGIFRLIPAVRNSRKVRISGVDLDVSNCEVIASALRMPNSVLTELHLTNTAFFEKATDILIDGLINSQCKLEALSILWCQIWFVVCPASCGRSASSSSCRAILSKIGTRIPSFLEGSPEATVEVHQPKLMCRTSLLKYCSAPEMSWPTNLVLQILSGDGLSQGESEQMASTIKAIISNLRELELSGNTLGDSLCSVLSDGLGSLEKLRLNRNPKIAEICMKLVTAFTSNPCYPRELELSYTSLKDSEMEILSTGLMNANCPLKILSLSHNRLSEKGCKTLASALSSKSSHLMDLDLSYNDLQDSGVTALCSALKHSHCGLTTLRLSFCKVTGHGCVALSSALRSDHCSLRELDLSFNHLTDQGAKLLTEVQRDSRFSLQKLNVDQNEECWFDLKLLRQYACDLTLDPNTAGVNVILTEENKKATYVTEKQSYPDNPQRFSLAQVLCEEGLTNRHYWEAECISAGVGVAYKSIDRVGDTSDTFTLGQNEKSWCWNYDGCFRHNNSHLRFMPDTFGSTIGVYLDWPAGILSFFEVFHDKWTHLYTVCTTFTEPLHPGFHVHDGSIYICKLK